MARGGRKVNRYTGCIDRTAESCSGESKSEIRNGERNTGRADQTMAQVLVSIRGFA